MTERSVSHTTFVIERSYPAHPARVFGAWTDGAAREIWMDDPDYKSDGSKYELDFRVGGHERFSGITPDGGTYRYEGVIYDIVPDQRIVYSYEMYVGQDLGSVSLATVEIVAEGSGTKLTYTEQGAFLDGIEKPEDRQQLGWMFDNFGKYLASSGTDDPQVAPGRPVSGGRRVLVKAARCGRGGPLAKARRAVAAG